MEYLTRFSSMILKGMNALNLSSDPNAAGRLAELTKAACRDIIREAYIQSMDHRQKHDTNSVVFQRDSAFRQNAVAPIDNLPMELFSNILIFAPPDGWEYDNHSEVIQSLEMIGRHWFEVVLPTPLIWSSLSEYQLFVQMLELTLVDIQF
ncbi:hypothetical protein FRB98_002378 [Tulasnella sp. 332]|nr:hypothetical protein FRB98_002378 [Tulasnella sp. 332]